MRSVILLGTSRTSGNTKSVCDIVSSKLHCETIMLADHNLSYYDYEHRNNTDDFVSLIKQLLQYDHIIFASPVYWYAMSGQMKVFFDRLSDLLTIELDLGRALRGKSCSIIATGTDEFLPSCFIEPFLMSANYLGMVFIEVLYCSSEKQDFVEVYGKQIDDFICSIS